MGIAITSIVLSHIGLFFSSLPVVSAYIGIPCSLLSIIFALVALGNVQAEKARSKGRGYTTLGLALGGLGSGCLGLFLSIIVTLFFAAL
ncbi:MAG: hypothetical protein Q4C03_02665 [bacterium]|nr:hypothetical protein [bacterium]MDO5462325.1 hypothetical protein [bacterium]